MRTIQFAGVMHAKFFVVDDDKAFLGSQNFDWRAIAWTSLYMRPVRRHMPLPVVPDVTCRDAPR